MRLSETALKEICRHGEETYPEECCGFLVGTIDDERNFVVQAIPVENNHGENRRRRFLITARDYLEAERMLRETENEIVGIYHSHPDHPARPSDRDLEDAAFVSFSYAISSVVEGKTADVRSWRLAADRTGFSEEAIHVVKETHTTGQPTR